MNKLEKLSIQMLLISLFLSWFRHYLWLEFNELGLYLAIAEHALLIPTFILAEYFHRHLVFPIETYSKMRYYYLSNLPMALWFTYALICNLNKIFSLTSLFI